MNRPQLTLVLTTISIGLVIVAMSLSAADDPAPSKKDGKASPVRVAEARRQAELLHAAFHLTLQEIHHEYYRSDQAMTVPAVTMKKIFRELEEQHHLKIRWLAINAQAMNIEHQPQAGFESDAVKAITQGEEQFELVDEGVYHHVRAIALQSECLKCHLPNRTSNKTRLAGLSISIPLSSPE